MNEVINNMLSRRSIRKYKPEQIKIDELTAIINAGLAAPSAGGRQDVLFLVTQDKATNEYLGKLNKTFFNGRISNKDVFISQEQPSIADDPTIKSAFYGAPTVITLFGAKNWLYTESDCSVAAENIMLAAHSLGIGSCMIGRAGETFETPYGQELLRKWNFDENYEPTYHILLGYPDCEMPKARERKTERIIWQR